MRLMRSLRFFDALMRSLRFFDAFDAFFTTTFLSFTKVYLTLITLRFFDAFDAFFTLFSYQSIVRLTRLRYVSLMRLVRSLRYLAIKALFV